MLARYFQRRSVRALWALLIAFAMLYALGLRVCVQGAGFAGAAGDAGAPSLYLESILATSDDNACAPEPPAGDGCGCWADISLFGIVNDVATASLLLPFLIVLVVLWPPRLLVRGVRPPVPLFATGRGFSLRPPPRAPPR